MRATFNANRYGLLLTLAMLAGTGFAAAEPKVFFTDIVSGPNSGGENGKGIYLSIFGKGFGASQGSSKVYINGSEVGAYKYWGPATYANGCCGSTPGRLDLDQITIQPGAGVSSGPINVVVDGQPSNSNHSFTVRPGAIYFLVPGSQDALGAVGDITKPYVGIHNLYNADGIHAESGFGAGDFMVLRGGTYLPRGPWDHWIRIDPGNEGTAALPLTVLGYPGENVILDGTNDPADNAIFFNGSDGDPPREGFVFANFKIKEDYDSVIRIGDRPEEMNHVRLVNLDIHGGRDGQSGTLEVRDADYVDIFGVYIHDNFVEPGHGSKYTHQIYFSDGSHDVEVGWVELARFDGGVTMSVRRSLEGPPWSVHYNMKFHNMVIHDQTSGAVVFGRSTGADISFYNNLIYRTGKHLGLSDDAVNDLSGVQIRDYWDENGESGGDIELDFYNNVIYDVGNENQPLGCYSFDEGSINMHNNVCVVLTPEPYGRMFTDGGMDHDNVTASHNLWWSPGGVGRWSNSSSSSPDPQIPTWLVGPTDVIADPQFLDPDAVAADFQLQFSSPAIDAGANAGFFAEDFLGAPRPTDGDGNGNASFDIGGFELQAPSVIPFVHINNPTTLSVYSTGSASISIGGSATDNVGVTGLSWSSSSGAAGNLPGGSSFLIEDIALEVGENVITVTAFDEDENSGSDTISVTRVIPPPPPGSVEVN